MSKKDFEKLDEMNLLWVFKQISVGNVVRGVMYVGKLFQSGVKCVERACKSAAENLTEEYEQPKTAKKAKKAKEETKETEKKEETK